MDEMTRFDDRIKQLQDKLKRDGWILVDNIDDDYTGFYKPTYGSQGVLWLSNTLFEINPKKRGKVKITNEWTVAPGTDPGKYKENVRFDGYSTWNELGDLLDILLHHINI